MTRNFARQFDRLQDRHWVTSSEGFNHWTAAWRGWMTASVMRSYLHQRKKEPEENPELEETLAKIDLLEERIRVLERIITENRFDLKKEIDSL